LSTSPLVCLCVRVIYKVPFKFIKSVSEFCQHILNKS
jgi:hypothetical protein